jgi:hypothetical protein
MGAKLARRYATEAKRGLAIFCLLFILHLITPAGTSLCSICTAFWALTSLLSTLFVWCFAPFHVQIRTVSLKLLVNRQSRW